MQPWASPLPPTAIDLPQSCGKENNAWAARPSVSTPRCIAKAKAKAAGQEGGGGERRPVKGGSCERVFSPFPAVISRLQRPPRGPCQLPRPDQTRLLPRVRAVTTCCIHPPPLCPSLSTWAAAPRGAGIRRPGGPPPRGVSARGHAPSPRRPLPSALSFVAHCKRPPHPCSAPPRCRRPRLRGLGRDPRRASRVQSRLRACGKWGPPGGSAGGRRSEDRPEARCAASSGGRGSLEAPGARSAGGTQGAGRRARPALGRGVWVPGPNAAAGAPGTKAGCWGTRGAPREARPGRAGCAPCPLRAFPAGGRRAVQRRPGPTRGSVPQAGCRLGGSACVSQASLSAALEDCGRATGRGEGLRGCPEKKPAINASAGYFPDSPVQGGAS